MAESFAGSGPFRLLVVRMGRVVADWRWPRKGPPLWDEMDYGFYVCFLRRSRR